MLGGIGGRRRRGRQGMRWLEGITDTMDMSFEWTPGVGDGQGGPACCNSWGRKESDMTEWAELNWTKWSSGFPYFLQFKSVFGNKKFMIWATVSSLSWFCWVYRASPPLAAKDIINLILVLTVWWCQCVESSLMLLEEGVCYDQLFSWQNSVTLWSASFCTPRPNLPLISGSSCLPTFAFKSPIMKCTFFLGVSSGKFCRSS